MRLAKNKELAHVVNDADSSFNLEDINKAIANASDEEKEEASVHVAQNTGQIEWYTPAEYIDAHGGDRRTGYLKAKTLRVGTHPS